MVTDCGARLGKCRGTAIVRWRVDTHSTVCIRQPLSLPQGCVEINLSRVAISALAVIARHPNVTPLLPI